jgi:hypothetical protein
MRHYSFDAFSVRPRDKCTVGALRAQAVDHDTSVRATSGAQRERFVLLSSQFPGSER